MSEDQNGQRLLLTATINKVRTKLRSNDLVVMLKRVKQDNKPVSHHEWVARGDEFNGIKIGSKVEFMAEVINYAYDKYGIQIIPNTLKLKG